MNTPQPDKLTACTPEDADRLLQSKRAPLGRKPDPVKSGRLAEARKLTALMSSGRGFSFVRVGDKDLLFLLNPQLVAKLFGKAANRVSGTQADGTPGLKVDQASRLRAALEQADYVDFCDCLWKDGSWLNQLKLKRRPGACQNPTRETSYILGTWLEHEFKNFCNGRRVLFCGAEAPLLEVFHRRECFEHSARAYWPLECTCFFLRPQNDGKDIGADLEVIKNDIRHAVRQYKIDAVFVSLGAAAKIICQELADEMGVCAFDFGVGLRSLTYSGSGGYLSSRATHLIFLYRLPFADYMGALEEAFPRLSPEVLLAKAHAQLLLDVQEKEVGWSHSAWEYDCSPENVAAFRESFREYKRRYRLLFRKSEATVKERCDLLHFCGTHALTWEGRIFLACFKAKSALARTLRQRKLPF